MPATGLPSLSECQSKNDFTNEKQIKNMKSKVYQNLKRYPEMTIKLLEKY
jgi:hypothetical protein